MTDYKKLYEDAIFRMNKWVEGSEIIDPKEVAEFVFPELKESEDERIRKAIHIYLDWLDGRKDYAPKGEYSIKDMIAWLEKQGEKLPVGFYYVDSNGNKYFSDTFKNGNFTFHVEKGEQIPANSAKTCKDEQKPADKIEPICEPKKATCNDYKKIIEHYGVRKQLKKLSEEVYELQESVIEYGLMPCKENKGNVVEQMADVMVLLKQFADWFEITPEEIAENMLNKVDRTLERIKKKVENDEQ